MFKGEGAKQQGNKSMDVSNNSKDKILESIENKGIYPNFFIDEFNW